MCRGPAGARDDVWPGGGGLAVNYGRNDEWATGDIRSGKAKDDDDDDDDEEEDVGEEAERRGRWLCCTLFRM